MQGTSIPSRGTNTVYQIARLETLKTHKAKARKLGRTLAWWQGKINPNPRYTVSKETKLPKHKVQAEETGCPLETRADMEKKSQGCILCNSENKKSFLILSEFPLK